MLAALTPTERAWLAILLVLWAALLSGGFLLGRPLPGDGRRMPRWTRIGSSLALVAAGWSWLSFSRGRAAPFPLLIAAGMSLGLAGDLFMSRVFRVRHYVLWGMAAFGLGHVAYIAGIIALSLRHSVDTALLLRVWLVWLLFGLVGWSLVALYGRPPSSLRAIHWAALPYALLLSSTAGLAGGLGLQLPAYRWLALGAALFLLSDLVLAARLFDRTHVPLLDDFVWLTYGPAQMLIVYSIGWALAAA